MSNSSLAAESARLRSEGTALLRKHGLLTKLGEYGEVFFTGSYAANLMMNGDIDMYVIGKWNRATVRKIFEQLMDEVDIKAWQLFNFVDFKDGRFPRAWYIGLRDVFRGRKWKIDIWFLDAKQMKKIPYASWDEVEVSEAQRFAILSFKKFRDEKKLDLPSLRIYEAVLEHGKKTTKAIREYCEKAE